MDIPYLYNYIILYHITLYYFMLIYVVLYPQLFLHILKIMGARTFKCSIFKEIVMIQYFSIFRCLRDVILSSCLIWLDARRRNPLFRLCTCTLQRMGGEGTCKP